MIKCYICSGTIESGCVCMAAAREIFPDIEKQYEDASKKEDKKDKSLA